ncbi:MAG: ATP-binding protein [Limnothrix sp. RL_2_0]|nr:ATP-binding protein [Limnothrix sp. RL_2_0]
MPKHTQHIFSHFLIGMPASGKSTFAQWLQRQTEAIIISTDEIRTALYGDAKVQGSWAAIETEVLKNIGEAIAQQQPIIYDATNTNYVWRGDFLRRCPPITWVAWWLNVSVEICLERNQRRSRLVPPEIVQHMATELHHNPPSNGEGFLETITLHDTDVATLTALKKQHPQYLGGSKNI